MAFLCMPQVMPFQDVSVDVIVGHVQNVSPATNRNARRIYLSKDESFWVILILSVAVEL